MVVCCVDNIDLGGSFHIDACFSLECLAKGGSAIHGGRRDGFAQNSAHVWLVKSGGCGFFAGWSDFEHFEYWNFCELSVIGFDLTV